MPKPTGTPASDLHTDPRWRLVERILLTVPFQKSPNLHALLSYLAEHSIQDKINGLTERQIGTAVFGKTAGYSPAEDSAVRVHVRQLRLRLYEYFAQEGRNETARVEIPKGSYALEFHDAIPEPGPQLSPQPAIALLEPGKLHPLRMTGAMAVVLCVGMTVTWMAGWWLRGVVHGRGILQDGSIYAFYNDLLGPIGAKSEDETEIALTNPHLLLYQGLESAGPPLGENPFDIPVPPEMVAVLNKTAVNNQEDFPFHHFFVDTTNYTGLGEATAAFGLARLLQATGRSANLTEERFLNWEAARQEQLVILGAPHMSTFVQSTLSAANFTIGYNSIHNAHPLPGEQENYYESRQDDVLKDYGLIWMTKSPSGTRILVLAGLSSAGTAGVGEFFSDPERMRPVYEKLRAASRTGSFPESWQVLLRIEARQDVPIRVTPVALRITGPN